MPQQPAIAESFGWCSPFVYIVFQGNACFLFSDSVQNKWIAQRHLAVCSTASSQSSRGMPSYRTQCCIVKLVKPISDGHRRLPRLRWL